MIGLKKILAAGWMFCLFGLLACSQRHSLPINGPLTLNSMEIEGEKVFMQNCQRCHPQGEAGLGPSIHWAPGFAKRIQTRHGFGAMPAFDQDRLSKENMDQLMAYLKAFKNN